jgi:hypothetical protein
MFSWPVTVPDGAVLMGWTRSRGTQDDRRWTDPPWSPLLGRSLDLAERGVAGFYAIRPREWSTRFRYDIASCYDHPELPFPSTTLAQIVRLEAPPPRAGRYRIVLRDPELFSLATEFDPLAVMTLTLAHEMVHLVRFGQGLACFELPERLRAAEERRVRRISERAVLDVVGPEHRPRVAELLAARDDGPA